MSEKKLEENRQVCKNCKHFGKYEKLTYCGRIEEREIFHDYSAMTKSNGNAVAEIGVESLDDSGLNVTLLVNENFGCVLFEGEEKENNGNDYN